MVRKNCSASTVVEMAYLMPLVLLVWALIIYGTLFFHDKAILSGAAYETAAVGSERIHGEEKIAEEKLEQYFAERIRGKLLFFGETATEVEISEEQITVMSRAKKKGMSVNVVHHAAITFPEKELRKINRIKHEMEGAME